MHDTSKTSYFYADDIQFAMQMNCTTLLNANIVSEGFKSKSYANHHLSGFFRL